MTLLAIDPGTTQSGFVIWDDKAKRVIDSGVLSNEEMLLFIKDDTMHGNVDRLAIEMIASYGMPVGAEVFETCVWIGKFLMWWNQFENSCHAQRVFRREVKLHLCGTARAKDSHVRQALIDKLGVVGTKKTPGPLYGVKSHAWPALGVAITALNL